MDLGVGDLRIAVPADVCVASKVEIGAGEARVLGRVNDGVDVSYEERPEAPPSASRLVLDAEIGLGAIEVRDANDVPFGFERLRPRASATTSTSRPRRERQRAPAGTATMRLGAPTSPRSSRGWRSWRSGS